MDADHLSQNPPLRPCPPGATFGGGAPPAGGPGGPLLVAAPPPPLASSERRVAYRIGNDENVVSVEGSCPGIRSKATASNGRPEPLRLRCETYWLKASH